MRSETGVMASREPFTLGVQKPTVQSPPSMQNMRLTFTPDGTAVYKPIPTSSPPPPPPQTHSYQEVGGGGGGGADGGPTGGSNGPSPAIPSPHGLNMNMGEPIRKKRGRPRKYGPDGSMALALSPVSPPSSGPPGSGPDGMKKKGRPPGSGRKMQMDALGNLYTCLFIAVFGLSCNGILYESQFWNALI